MAGDNLSQNGGGNSHATQVTCAGGRVAILGTDNQVFFRTDVSNDLPEGKGWVSLPGLDEVTMWEQVTLGENGHMWMLNNK